MVKNTSKITIRTELLSSPLLLVLFASSLFWVQWELSLMYLDYPSCKFGLFCSDIDSVGLFGFFVLFLIWVNISVHFSLSVVVSDVCYDVYKYTIPV